MNRLPLYLSVGWVGISGSHGAALECEPLSGSDRQIFATYAMEYATHQLRLVKTDVLLQDPMSCEDGTISVAIDQRTRLRNWLLIFNRQSGKISRVTTGE
jgi:hypothetical protein